MNQIPHNRPLPVTLMAEQWEVVMRAVAQLPYAVAKPIIDGIREQCMTAAEEPVDG